MKNIDPYYEWLGIPPKHQPPDHYRLLGLELFEDDRNVIATAADRQMGFIKTYQTGPTEAEELSQRILNELAAARICLLTPQKKKDYDWDLRTELEKKRANTAVSGTEGLPGDDLIGQSQPSAATVPTEPSGGLPMKSPGPAISTQIIGMHPLPQRAIPQPPMPRLQIRRASNDSSEQSSIVPMAIGVGIGCILLAGLLLAWFAMHSGRTGPTDLEPPIVAESIAVLEHDDTGEKRPGEVPPAEPDLFERQVVEEPGESAGSRVPSRDDVRKYAQEPSDEPPDVQPIPAPDSEASLPAVAETLEQAEQRLNFEAAGALPDSAREQFVQEVLSVTDRAIVDSDAELARRLAELALKVARASNSPELIQRVTLRLVDVRGPMTETLKQEAHQRLDQP